MTKKIKKNIDLAGFELYRFLEKRYDYFNPKTNVHEYIMIVPSIFDNVKFIVFEKSDQSSIISIDSLSFDEFEYKYGRTSVECFTGTLAHKAKKAFSLLSLPKPKEFFPFSKEQESYLFSKPNIGSEIPMYSHTNGIEDSGCCGFMKITQVNNDVISYIQLSLEGVTPVLKEKQEKITIIYEYLNRFGRKPNCEYTLRSCLHYLFYGHLDSLILP